MRANRLYFAQHGLAVDSSVDSERPLSGTGIEQTTAIARQLNTANISISQIFHSGKLRAQQTADIFAQHLSVNAVTSTKKLSAMSDVKHITQDLQINDALYIGHLPHLGHLASLLVTGKTEPGIIQFHNSAVLCLTKQEANYLIQWYLSADLNYS